MRHAAYTTFCLMWKTLLPHITVMKPMTDLCAVCQHNSTAIMRAANLPVSCALACAECGEAPDSSNRGTQLPAKPSGAVEAGARKDFPIHFGTSTWLFSASLILF